MTKLKYGLLLILVMTLFSVPVLAAKTYYLPSKLEEGEYYKKYTYNKYGHLIRTAEMNEESDGDEEFEVNWDYNYKNGKRVSGEYTEVFGTRHILAFDKKQYLKRSRYRYDYEGGSTNYTWNKKGYIEKGGYNHKYTYYYSGDGKLKKSALYTYGKKYSVSYYDKDGFVTKTVIDSEYRKQTITYKYKFNKNGLVNTIIKTTTNNESGKKEVENIKVSYSKVKTDKKTYTLFINGNDSCFDNALL